MTIIPTKNIKLIIINYCTMRMSWTWASLWITNFLERPFPCFNIISMEVINSIKTIVTTKYINLAIVYNSSMSITR